MDYVALQGRLEHILRERDAIDAEVEVLESTLTRRGASYDPDPSLIQEELDAARAQRGG
jgi:hypothetical protein